MEGDAAERVRGSEVTAAVSERERERKGRTSFTRDKPDGGRYVFAISDGEGICRKAKDESKVAGSSYQLSVPNHASASASICLVILLATSPALCRPCLPHELQVFHVIYSPRRRSSKYPSRDRGYCNSSSGRGYITHSHVRFPS